MALSAGGDSGRRSPELAAHRTFEYTLQHAGIDSQDPTPTTAKQERSPDSEAGAKAGICVSRERSHVTIKR